MSSRDEVEELKARKERLLLEREIARLERRKQFDGAVDRWRWIWVAPVGLLGAFLFLAGIGSGEPVPVILGLVGLAPGLYKVWRGRKQ